MPALRRGISADPLNIGTPYIAPKKGNIIVKHLMMPNLSNDSMQSGLKLV